MRSDSRPNYPGLDGPRVCRALFLSDLHLGTKGAQAERVLDFLNRVEADAIYLVGDIIDGWRLRRKWFWPQSHNDVAQAILRRARDGVRIVYLPGNHDEVMRDFFGIHFGGIEVIDEVVHEAADGKRYLVIHGDQFDMVVRHARWLAFLGDIGYRTAMWANVYVNLVRRRLGFSYWSLSAWLKGRVKTAVNYVGEFEKALVDAANQAGADGVICGHIHTAAMADMDGTAYVNTGDWVESCTAVIENADGTFEIVDWAALSHNVIELRAPAPPLRRAAG